MALLVQSLIQRGELAEARTELAGRELLSDLPPTCRRTGSDARGCLSAASGDHRAAVTDLLAAGELAQRWGIRNPAMMNWRSAAGISLAALGRDAEARALCAAELELAREWGTSRGSASRCAPPGWSPADRAA